MEFKDKFVWVGAKMVLFENYEYKGLTDLEEVYRKYVLGKKLWVLRIVYTKINFSFNSIFHEIFEVPLCI